MIRFYEQREQNICQISVRAKLIIPANPSFLATWTAVLPFSLFNFDTTVSAGWETTAQKTPAEIKWRTLFNYEGQQ